jgi:uncharacterized protein (DUF302 family)
MKKKIGLFLLVAICLTACKNKNEEKQWPPQQERLKAIGISYTQQKGEVEEAYQKLKSTLRKNSAIGIIAESDYAQEAAQERIDLAPEKIIFFGNPNLGTPLMQANQLTGLNLPQKILFFQNGEEFVTAYNSTNYLGARFGIKNTPSLNQMSDALERLVENAAGQTVVHTRKQHVKLLEGIITTRSKQSFTKTKNSLLKSIHDNQKLELIASLDHQANAASVGMSLRPTYVLMVSYPEISSRMLRDNALLGLDLPHKILVWENAKGRVFVSYNAIDFIAKRQGMEINANYKGQIERLLHQLVETATKP